MHLIGMLDSPYVRRCAIIASQLGLPFEHSSVSVFRHMERFASFNPLYKAPTLVTDDGTVLMDSGLCILHIEDVAKHSLRPATAAARVKDLRLEGLGINICDKAVAIEYERKRAEAQRSPEWQHRIAAQVHQALKMVEAEADFDAPCETPGLITAVIGWGFIRFVTPDIAQDTDYPRLAAYAKRAEQRPEFVQYAIDKE